MRKNRFVLALCLGLSAVAPAAASATAAPPVADDGPAPLYTLGTGDQVRVTVYGEDKLTGQYSVGSDGSLALPLVGNIQAAGKTTVEVQAAITTALSHGFMLEPHVSVEMLNYRPFFVLGEVNRPGQYPYVEQMSLAQVVATAGGYTYRANEHAAFVRHKGETKEKRLDAGGGKTIWIMPGDTVRIGQRYF